MIHKCKICGLTYTSRTYFDAHVRSHGDGLLQNESSSSATSGASDFSLPSFDSSPSFDVPSTSDPGFSGGGGDFSGGGASGDW